MKQFSRFLLALALCSLAACEKQAPVQDAFGLKTTQLKVGKELVVAEIADRPETMATGLMYRKSLPGGKMPDPSWLGRLLQRSIPYDRGMIFVFPAERQASFWMHNTDLPLDIAYLDQAGKVLEVHAAQPHDETPIPSATANIAFALEMNQGWFREKGIAIGTKVENLPAFPPRN